MHKMMLLALAASLLTAPAALAQEEPACPEGYTETPEGCSQQAWVDDCPPDHMCAASEDPDGSGAEPGQAMGPDDCIECSRPPADGNGTDGSGTCMDGAEADEDCRDDVQYIGGPGGPDAPVSDTDDGAGRGPPLCENCRGDAADGAEPEAAAQRDAPAAGALVGLGLLGAAVLARRRSA
jgi:hypothetical protein